MMTGKPWWTATDTTSEPPPPDIALAAKELGRLARQRFPGLSLQMFEQICLQAAAITAAVISDGDRAAALRHSSESSRRLRKWTDFAMSVAAKTRED